jgi:hypothetical protein
MINFFPFPISIGCSERQLLGRLLISYIGSKVDILYALSSVASSILKFNFGIVVVFHDELRLKFGVFGQARPSATWLDSGCLATPKMDVGTETEEA